MRNIIIIIFIIFITVISAGKISAQDRYATCDQCGYCQLSPTPGNWLSCKQCLYPTANSDASSKETLKIDPVTGNPPQSEPGNYYTMIGCINTSLDSFTNPLAAGSVTQKLLNIVFSIAGGIAFLYLLYGSFLVLTSQSDPEKLNQGKRVIYGAIIGVIFAFSAVFIVNMIASNVLKIPGFSQ
ncbi:MAG: hypothetical protein HYW86_00435 [Candidatus Roizmanbacteria bacterium]|nr:MAG: hypothetical protein HYW86_00435 [Candidatus Roizmanbacteria bacterium]